MTRVDERGIEALEQGAETNEHVKKATNDIGTTKDDLQVVKKLSHASRDDLRDIKLLSGSNKDDIQEIKALARNSKDDIQEIKAFSSINKNDVQDIKVLSRYLFPVEVDLLNPLTMRKL